MKKRSLKSLSLNKKSISNLETYLGGHNNETGGCIQPSRLRSRCPEIHSNCSPCPPKTVLPTINVTLCTITGTIL